MPEATDRPQADTGNSRRIGVLVINLGTPDAPTTPAVRRYLREFLSDPRVVEAPRALWWLVLNAYILRVRPARSAAAYRKVWTPAGSPLLVNSRALVEGLRRRLSASFGERFELRLAMTYGEPAIAPVLEELLETAATRLVVLPLYPQYSASTAGAAFDAVADALARQRRVPDVCFVSCYWDCPGYVDALAASVRAFRADKGAGEKLLFSFHGLPRKMVDRGDPYLEQCRATAERVAATLGLAAADWTMSFQSRVGREEWLRPYTDETLADWGARGMGDIDVLCPGFAADCLETLEEIAIQNAALYRAAGGGDLRYIPALNDSEAHIDMLARLVADRAAELGGRDADTAAREARP